MTLTLLRKIQTLYFLKWNQVDKDPKIKSLNPINILIIKALQTIRVQQPKRNKRCATLIKLKFTNLQKLNNWIQSIYQ